MRAFDNLACAFILSVPFHAAAQVVNLRERILVYEGVINQVGAKRLKAALEGKGVEALHIDSVGGEVEAGIRIGNAILDHRLDVVVTKRCFSSCANYVFTAGRRKQILPGAMVAWHGSALQWNFRERYARIENAIETSGIDSLSEADRRFFDHNGKLQAMQREFFARVGVNEYVTRLGQEPINHKVTWTISVPDMEKFGIRGVTAPSGTAHRATVPIGCWKMAWRSNA